MWLQLRICGSSSEGTLTSKGEMIEFGKIQDHFCSKNLYVWEWILHFMKASKVDLKIACTYNQQNYGFILG